MDSASALAELKGFQSTRKGAGDYFQQSQDELGVGAVKTRADDMRGLIRNTETALKGVNASVGGRTRGQLVTEAQRARLENLERQPLMEGLSGLQGGYADEMQSYRDLLGQAGQKAQFSYQTDADKLASLEGNYTKLFQKEQADEERRRWEAQMAESRRAAAAQERMLAQQANLFKPTTSNPAAGNVPDVTKLKAQADVGQLMQRKGTEAFYREINAIAKSAGFGNAYDQAKLQLIAAAQPGLFPGGKLDTKRLGALYGSTGNISNQGGWRSWLDFKG